MKKVFFAVVMLLPASSSFALSNSHRGTIQSELTRPHTWGSVNPNAADLPNPSSPLGTEGGAAREVDDLDQAETYSCPIQLDKPHSISSASGNYLEAFDAKECPGVVP